MHALTPAVMLAFIATGAAASSAVDCPAHRGIYLRDGDGATFTARRYGEAEDGAFFYSMQEGTLGRRVAYNVQILGIPNNGGGGEAGFASSFFRGEEADLVKIINWRPVQIPSAASMIPSAFTTGPLNGTWKLTGCRT